MYQPHRVGTEASFTRYVDAMKRSKTHVDNLGIQALANLYPELGRIMFLSTNTGKVVLHYFMNSDDPSMKLIRADDIISRAAVKTAMQA